MNHIFSARTLLINAHKSDKQTNMHARTHNCMKICAVLTLKWNLKVFIEK